MHNNSLCSRAAIHCSRSLCECRVEVCLLTIFHETISWQKCGSTFIAKCVEKFISILKRVEQVKLNIWNGKRVGGRSVVSSSRMCDMTPKPHSFKPLPTPHMHEWWKVYLKTPPCCFRLRSLAVGKLKRWAGSENILEANAKKQLQIVMWKHFCCYGN